MHLGKSLILSLCVAALTTGVFAAPLEPNPVKTSQSMNRIYQRKVEIANRDTYKTLLKAPQMKYISLAEVSSDTKIPAIIGGMIDSGSWTDGMYPYGLYQLPTKAGDPFTFICSNIFPNGGGVEANGTYYSCEVEESSDGVSIIIRAYDTETWRNTRSFSPSDYSFIATDVAHDPLTDQNYGCLWDDSGFGYMFGTIDYKSGYTKKIKELENMWNAVAIDADGTIYAIDQVMVDHGTYAECVKSCLYKVNRNTGAMTLVGETGLLPYYASSAVIDRKSGRMFWSVTPKDDSQSALYEVNKNTGECTLLYRYPAAEQFMGMYIPAPPAEDEAPAAVQNLKANFDKGSLSGSVSFTVPTLTYGGSKGEGNLSYSIYVDGASVADGNTTWGKNENVPVTLAKGGEIEFSVTLTGDGGVSPIEKVKTFVGTDVPVSPSVTATWNSGVMNVTWTVPEKSVNGGYIDPKAITYKVTRYPDGVVVASSTNRTDFSESLAEPDGVVSYYYAVEASFAGKTSAPGYSNRIVLGAALPPYSLDFTNLDNLDNLTIINIDPLSKAWTLSAGALLLRDDRMMEKDDWVITEPVRLVPGKVYSVTVKASSQGTNYPEYIEVFCGDNNTVEAMTEQVIEKTIVSTASSSAYKEFTGYVSTEKERTVFIGVHGCSPADVYNLRLASIELKAAFESTAPGAATDFMVTPDVDGGLSVDITFNAPAADYDGNPISSLSSLVIYRDGAEIYKTSNVTPGQTVNYTDNNVTAGEHTYSVIAHNESGMGREIKEKVFVGVGVPVAPARVNVVETETPGEVKITWAQVNTDVNGYALSSNLVSYTVYTPNADASAWTPVATGLSGDNTTLTATDGNQIFAIYAVAAVTSGGTSSARVSDVIAVGNPYTLPYSETFANGEPSTIFTYSGNGGDWEICANDPMQMAQADDNGYARMFGEYYGSNASLVTGKINLAGAINPVLKFSTFNYYTALYGPDHNAIAVYVKESGSDWKLIHEYIVNDVANQNNWGAVTIKLDAYTGKTIQLRFHATNYTYDNTTLDQIRIDNGVDDNLSLVAITAPETVKAGEKFNIVVKVENNGINDASEFSVDLYKNGAKYETKTVDKLVSGRGENVTFEDVFTPLDEESSDYYAELTYRKDLIVSDNKSEVIEVKPELSILPVVTNLAAVSSNGEVTLSWDEPNTDDVAPDPIVESFESAQSYATTGQCGWTFVDADGAPTQPADVIIGVVDPNDYTKYLYEPGVGDESPLAWAVLDHNYGFGRVSWFTPHTGYKLLIALAAAGVQNDDWAISPELYGGIQTVSFWAKSYSDDPAWGTERFQLLYSTTGVETSDFTLVAEKTICSSEWLPFSFEVPDGAKYFAVRCISNDNYSLMVDDFSFIPKGATADISLLGYNVYRDGAKINGATVEDVTYTDKADAGNHSYAVTAIYDKGESRISNIVSIELSGVDGINTTVSIALDNRTLIVNGAKGCAVSIVKADGTLVANAIASEIYSYDFANAGIYIVSVGDKTLKVIVK